MPRCCVVAWRHHHGAKYQAYSIRRTDDSMRLTKTQAALDPRLTDQRERPTKTTSGPEDSIPLFLSDDAGEPGRARFCNRQRAIGAPRLVANPRQAFWRPRRQRSRSRLFPWITRSPLLANAKASLPGTSAGVPINRHRDPRPPLAPAPNRQRRQIDPLARSRQTSPGAPTRDEIAAALRTAHQGQLKPAAAQSLQPRPLQSPSRSAGKETRCRRTRDALKRAKGLIAIGDIPPARLLLERAADAQEAGAALLLAQTYDPAVLGTPDARSITPDPATARAWYQKAAQLGSTDAKQRLAQMQN